MNTWRLLMIVATVASAGSWFDGDGGVPFRPVAPMAPAARPLGPATEPYGDEVSPQKPAPVPPDLVAALPRVGNAAMLAKLVPRAGTPFAFGVIGDAEVGRFWWERLFSPGKSAFVDQWRTLQSSDVDFVLQLGDFVSQGDAKHYREHVALMEREAVVPLLRCVGNHDRSRPNGEADKTLYDAVFGVRDYYFDHGGWRFVSLDSSDRKVTTAQLAWLQGVLASTSPKVIFTHVPPAYLKHLKPLAEAEEFEAGSEEPQAAAEEKGYWRDLFTNYFTDGSSQFEELVTNGGVKAVYMGHIHAFWAADHRGVRYIISGGGGSPLYPLPPGYPLKRFAHTIRVSAGPSGGLIETVVPYGGTPSVLPPVN